MKDVHVVLPNDIDDPTRPSGGNVYDRQVCDGLAAAGWSVRELAIHGAWPEPGPAEQAELARALAALPDRALVVVDGLVGSAAGAQLAAQAQRLRLVALIHLPLGHQDAACRRGEERALSGAAAIVTTSEWARGRLVELYALPAGRIQVAQPGVQAAPVAPASAAGDRLLCVAAIAWHKGQDVLTEALAGTADLPWRCTCVGSLAREPEFGARIRARAAQYGLAGRLSFVGTRVGPDLAAWYAGADLLVVPSRGETYGMVVTEALARAIPVLATAVNGLPESLGCAPDGSLPGLLVAADDPAALASALRRWLTEPGLRATLRRSAGARRHCLTGWDVTCARVSETLHRVARS